LPVLLAHARNMFVTIGGVVFARVKVNGVTRCLHHLYKLAHLHSESAGRELVSGLRERQPDEVEPHPSRATA